MSIFNFREWLGFSVYWLWCLIKNNKVKAIALGVVLLTFPNLNCLPDKTNRYFVDHHYRSGDLYVYVTVEKRNSGLDYDVRTSERPIRLVGGYIVEKTWNDVNIILWVPFVIAVIILLVGVFANDDDLNWEFDEVFYDAISPFVRCELEDGLYHYFVGERFLGKYQNDQRGQSRCIGRRLSINSFTCLRNAPVWKTKSMSRKGKLEELGI